MKRIAILFLVFCLGAYAFSEELIDIFINNFKKSNHTTKLQILQDSVNKNIEGRGLLFNEALFYVINNYKTVGDQNTTNDICMLSISQVDTLLYKPARTALWDLFLLNTATRVRMNIFQALAHLANDDPEIIKKINTWLTVQNDNFRITKTNDFQVITSCINTLGAIADPSSFPPLFLVPYTGYPDAVKKAAEEALYALKGSLKDMYINMINIGRFNEKRYTLDKALAETKMDNTEKCEVAFAALKIAVNTVIDPPDEKDIARDIRNKAVVFLGDNGYSAAVEFGIAHFKRSLEEFESKRMPSTGLLAVIRALGQFKSHEAAVELKNYLDNINSQFEDGKPYEEQVVLQVISSLEMLGDKVARSSLLYVGYLRYSDKIKKAADAAFNVIK